MIWSVQLSVALRRFRGEWLCGAALLALWVTLLPAPAFAAKLEICHKPDSPSRKIREIKQSELAEHLGHGDYIVAAESCDTRDNDCDGLADETFNLRKDPDNCGSCGNKCSFPHATAICNAGVCAIGSCKPGYVDIDPAAPGCETACTPTSNAERCDNIDNNCNGVIDEGFNKLTDPLTCGPNCTTCALSHAVAGCAAGQCTVASCQAGWVNLNGNPADGCEYQCTPSGAETCDNVDNDCDGTVDEGFNKLTDPLHCGASCTACTLSHAVPSCSLGQCTVESCEAGWVNLNDDAADGCEYQCTATGPEICDNIDNNCDGNIDEGIDKLTNPQSCGDSCTVCSFSHAIPGCSVGQCTIAGCELGWRNLDGNAANGCEYQCTPSGQEVCDGVDNDCDALIDQADPSMLAPANFCRIPGECAGTTPSCTGETGWKCLYADPDVDLDANGDILADEIRCDGLDNDCDGVRDESFPEKGFACAEDGTFGSTRKLGVCRGSGTLFCNGAKTGLFCKIEQNGMAPSHEVCNNLDDDCDGHVDEPYDAFGWNGVRDVLVGPVVINGQSVSMYRYEAARPDASRVNEGVIESRACSVAGRLPWASADFNEARNACLKAGMRLCQVTRDGSGQVLADEWGRFCQGPSDLVFPYGNTFSPGACNGAEFDPVPGGANEDIDLPTGDMAACQSTELARDMSGNVKEWVDDPRTVGGITVHTLRGGAFDTFEQGLSCDADVDVAPLDFASANAGFRCCSRACPIGQSDCNGTCTNLASSSTNCGACGQTCPGGNICSNGYCCPTGTRACNDVLCVPVSSPCP